MRSNTSSKLFYVAALLVIILCISIIMSVRNPGFKPSKDSQSAILYYVISIVGAGTTLLGLKLIFEAHKVVVVKRQSSVKFALAVDTLQETFNNNIIGADVTYE